jgi:hypothetical protein
VLAEATVGAVDRELVAHSGTGRRHEELPHAGRAEGAHRQHAVVPRGAVADERDRARAGRPHRERRADDALLLAHVRTEHPAELAVVALAEQVEVEVAERREEPVGILDRLRRVGQHELIRLLGIGARQRELEQAPPVDAAHRAGLAVDDDRRGAAPRHVGAHHRAGSTWTVDGVDAEQLVRVVLRPGEQAFELVLDGGRREPAHTTAPSSRSTMLPTGMSTQSGRWSSS